MSHEAMRAQRSVWALEKRVEKLEERVTVFEGLKKEQALEWFRLGFECGCPGDWSGIEAYFETAWEYVEKEKAPSAEAPEAQLEFDFDLQAGGRGLSPEEVIERYNPQCPCGAPKCTGVD